MFNMMAEACKRVPESGLPLTWHNSRRRGDGEAALPLRWRGLCKLGSTWITMKLFLPYL
jgi:hypothetical protein